MPCSVSIYLTVRVKTETYGVLHNHKVALVFERNAEVIEEGIGGLAHNHGAEELASEPSTASWSNASLDDGNLEVRALLAENVGSAQTTGASTDNDNVRLGVVVQVGKVAPGHGPRDLRLADGSEGERLPLVLHLGQRLGLAIGSRLDGKVLLHGKILLDGVFIATDGNGVFERSGWWRHVGEISQGCSGSKTR